MITGPDISHHQGAVNWAAVAAAGHQFAVIKATEGVGFVDPQLAANRAGAHAAGLAVGLYHFARAGNPAAEAAYFTGVTGQLQAGEFAVLDWEVPAADPVGWCTAWLAAVRGQLGMKPLLYLNRSTLNGYNWSPVVAADSGLWLAAYDGSTAAVASGAWPGLAMKQYTDKGSVPGVAGPVDVNVFYGTADQLRAYGAPGNPTPAPAPPPPPPPAPTPPPPPPPAPSFDVRAWRISFGQQDAHLPALQAWANRMYPGYASTPIGPLSVNYGPQTARFLVEFCKRVGIASDGRDIGPKTAAALYAQGFRG